MFAQKPVLIPNLSYRLENQNITTAPELDQKKVPAELIPRPSKKRSR